MQRRRGGRRALVDLAALNSSSVTLGEDGQEEDEEDDDDFQLPTSVFVPNAGEPSTSSPSLPAVPGPPSLTSLISYDSDDDAKLDAPAQQAPHPPPAPPHPPYTSLQSSVPFSTPSLDDQINSFLHQISPLLTLLTPQLSLEDELFSTASTRWFSSLEPTTGRRFYYDEHKRVVTWHRPMSFTDSQEGEEDKEVRGEAKVDEQVEVTTIGVKDLFESLRRMLSELRSRVGEGDAEGREACGLLECELRIREEDWEERAVSDEYVSSKLRLLIEKVEQRLSLGGGQRTDESFAPPPPSAVTSSPTQSAVTDEASTSDAYSEAIPRPASLPIKVERRAVMISRPPSNPNSSLTTTCQLNLPSSVTAPQPSPIPSDVSYRSPSPPPPPRPSKVRKVEAVGGVVGAMLQKWKGVKAMEEEEERRRGGSGSSEVESEEERVVRLENGVKNEGRKQSRLNPNLIPVADWRPRGDDRSSSG